MADGIDTGIFLATIFCELFFGSPSPELLPLVCITDNHSLYDTINSANHVHEKRLRFEISGIKELILSKQISSLKWSEAKTQVADCLTKKGASSHALLRLLEEGFWEHQD